MVTVRSNIPALSALSHSRENMQTLGSAIERLSSGLRVNGAKDDAAALAISNRMTANLRANSTITRGINDGISLMQVAEGGLNEINNLVQRSRELAVQAANGTLSDSDRASINQEFHQLREEIDRIARDTEAFGKHPLAPAPTREEPAKIGDTPSLEEKFPVKGQSGTFSSGIVSVAYIPAGAEKVTLEIDSLGADDDIQIFARNGKHLVGTPILDNPPGSPTDYVWQRKGIVDAATAQTQLLTPSNGFAAGATYNADDLLVGGAFYNLGAGGQSTYNGMQFTYSGDGERYETGIDPLAPDYPNNGRNGGERLERIHINKATEELLLFVVGEGAFTATVNWDSLPAATQVISVPPPHSEPVDIVTSANFGGNIEKITIEPTPSDSYSLGIDGTELDPYEMALKALGEFDEALNTLNTYRGQYGALQNRFESAISAIAEQSLATQAARSRLQDADYSAEVSRMARAQIIQQAGSAAMTQANALPQAALTLLQN